MTTQIAITARILELTADQRIVGPVYHTTYHLQEYNTRWHEDHVSARELVEATPAAERTLIYNATDPAVDMTQQTFLARAITRASTEERF